MSNPPSLLTTSRGTFRVAIDGSPDAPALVLSNSLGTTLEMWDAQVAALSASHRLIRYDTRGHGGSPVTPGPYRMDDLGQDVLALLDALNIDQAYFCGISMGGHTGLWLGVLGQDKLLKLAAGEADVRQVPALAISLEPKGGVPSETGPTGPVLFKGELIQRML